MVGAMVTSQTVFRLAASRPGPQPGSKTWTRKHIFGENSQAHCDTRAYLFGISLMPAGRRRTASPVAGGHPGTSSAGPFAQ